MANESKNSDPIDVQATQDQLMEQAFIDLVSSIDPLKDPNETNFKPRAVVLSDTKIHPVQVGWTDDSSKEEKLKLLGETCYNKECSRIILINDVVFKSYNHRPDPLTEQPLSYPKEMRNEGLILCYIDFIEPKNNFFRVYPYKFENNVLIKGDVINFTHENIMIMDSFMLSNVSFGFTRAAMLDICMKEEIVSKPMTVEVGDMLLSKVLKKHPGATLGKDLLKGRADTEEILDLDDDLDIEDHPKK